MQHISLKFHQTLSTATGDVAMDVLTQSMAETGYYLIVEGAMPAGMPKACTMGHQLMTDLVAQAATNAQAVIAIGSCASYGGIPASEGNQTGAVSVPAFLQSRGVNTPTIILPTCPGHPDWLVGTIVHLLASGMPGLDADGRPNMFYGQRVHSQRAGRLAVQWVGRITAKSICHGVPEPRTGIIAQFLHVQTSKGKPTETLDTNVSDIVICRQALTVIVHIRTR